VNHHTKILIEVQLITTSGFKNNLEGKDPGYIPKLLQDNRTELSIPISGLYRYISSIKEPKLQKTKGDTETSKEA
jgi:hypothetical protein